MFSGNPVIVVDGSNIAWDDLSDAGKPLAANIVAVAEALRGLGYEPLVFVDAALRHQVADPDLLKRLIHEEGVRQTPASTDGDVWLLKAAESLGAPLVSNDLYKDYRHLHPWLDQRQVRAMLVAGRVLLHGGGIPDLQPLFEAPAVPGQEKPANASEVAAYQQLLAERDRELMIMRASLDALTADRALLRTEVARLVPDASRAADLERQNADLRAHVASLEAGLSALEALREAAAQWQREAVRLAREAVDAQEGRTAVRLEAARQAAHLRGELEVTKAALHETRAARETALRQVERLAQQVKALKEDGRQRTSKDSSEVLRALRELQRTSKSSLELMRGLEARYVGIVEALGDLPVRLDRIDERLKRIKAEQPREGSAEQDGDAAPGNAEDDTSPALGNFYADESWQAEFDRIERAWLAGRLVGDPHDGVPFNKSARLLRHGQQHLRDDDRLLTEMDALRKKFGEGFSYCLVYLALKKLRKPSLTSPVLLVKMRQIHQNGFCRSHLATSTAHGGQATPGVGP